MSSILLQMFKLQVNGKSEPHAQMSRATRSALCRVPTRLALVAHLLLLPWSTIGHSPRVAVVQHSPDGTSPHGVARGAPQSYGSFLDCKVPLAIRVLPDWVSPNVPKACRVLFACPGYPLFCFCFIF